LRAGFESDLPSQITRILRNGGEMGSPFDGETSPTAFALTFTSSHPRRSLFPSFLTISLHSRSCTRDFLLALLSLQHRQLTATLRPFPLSSKPLTTDAQVTSGRGP
jgi:hypothetical protein